jgi:hypothetical protein
VTVAYFSCISFLSWESHFTVTRHALPITLLFNLLLAKRPTRAWFIWFLLGNCFVPFGIRNFDSLRDVHSPAPLPEFEIVASAGKTPAVDIAYGDGWSQQQWSPDNTWRWARGETAVLVLHNRGSRPARGELRFITRVMVPRTLEIKKGATSVLRESLAMGRHVIMVRNLQLAPGETRLTFSTDAPPNKPDDDTTGNEVTFKVENPQLMLLP